ncbi:MAG TPA: protein kinase [Anaerolineae bacterium]|nr:protein kinase [Anaerolineae bacterium]
MPLELNSLLHNRYRILEELGHGGMDAVYRGHDESLGVEVAIKENLFVSPEAERQFKREASLLAALRHPNLPRVTDHFVVPEEGQYLVMDYVPGDDARQILDHQGGPLPEELVLQWAKEILSALKYLHTRPQPIIHRDIKPGNIKITPEGRAVLVDFGLAKTYDAMKSTTVGAKAFTPGFAPPEQYGQGRTNERTDIYSLGATLYNLLTYLIPADGLARAMGQQRLIPVLEANPSLSVHVAEAIEHAVATKPEQRFASTEEFLEALSPKPVPEPILTSKDDATLLVDYVPPTAPSQVSPPGAPPQAPPRPEAISAVSAPSDKPKRGLRLIPLVFLIVVAVGFGAWGVLTVTGVFDRSGETPTPLATATEAEEVVAIAPGATATATEILIFEPTETLMPEYTPTPEVSPTPAATPRGGGSGQIAFVSEREGLPQIYLINVDRTNLTRLTNISDGACQPAWSPDGERLLFVSPCNKKADKYPNAAIYVMNPDGTGVEPLITLIGGVHDPDWSTAGILFTYLADNKPRIWVANEQGRDREQISMENAYDTQPCWSPGGDKIVLTNTSRALGVPTIYWVRSDGSFDGENPYQVTRDREANSPDWSPSGDLIAYVYDKIHIYVVKWDAVGFGANQLTTKGPNADPDWSPDGQWMTFESWRDAANHDIYIMTANGGLQTRLTEDPAWDYQPAWRP